METYLSFFLIAIPLFYIASANGSHDHLAVIFSLPLWVYWLVSGFPVFLPLAVFAAWLVLSLMWSTMPKQSVYDLLLLLSVFSVALAASEVSRFEVAFYAFLPAPGMAALDIYQALKKHKAPRRGALFGNTNHAGIYYAVTFFCGAWLSVNISPVFLPFTALVLLGVTFTECRTGFWAVCAGFGLAVGQWFGCAVWLLALGVVAGLIAAIVQRPKHHVKMAVKDRGAIFLKTARMILRRPCFGWGLRTFRKEHNQIPPAMSTHRVHNDLLEIAFEVGVIGFILAGWFFYSLKWDDPFLSGGVLAGLVSSMFFFTFREAHTAAPVLAMCGMMLPGPIDYATIPVIVAVVASLAIFRAFYEAYVHRIVALYYYAVGGFSKDMAVKQRCIEKAAEWHPSTEYMTRKVLFTVQRDPLAAFDEIMRMVYQYDGRVVWWMALDQAARICYATGALNLAVYFNKRALDICPQFGPAISFKKGLEETLNKFKEANNARVI